MLFYMLNKGFSVDPTAALKFHSYCTVCMHSPHIAALACQLLGAALAKYTSATNVLRPNSVCFQSGLKGGAGRGDNDLIF